MGDEGMVSFEEFDALQQRLLGVEQENYVLKEELQRLTRANPNLQADVRRLDEEREKLDDYHSEAQARHRQSLDALNEAIDSVRRQIEEQVRCTNSRLAEASAELADLTQKCQEKAEAIERLQEKVSSHDDALIKKSSKLQFLVKGEQVYRPHIDFLRRSRAFPMYMEDLDVRIAALTAQKTQHRVTLDILVQRRGDLKGANREMKSQIRNKSAELTTRYEQTKSASARLESALKESERTERAVAEATQRLGEARAQTAGLFAERARLEQELADIERRGEADFAEFERQKAERELQLVEVRESRQSEMAEYNERIQILRKKVNCIKDTDDDPDGPRIDVDLRRQIEKVKAEKAELRRETERIRKQTRAAEIQVQQRTWDLQSRAMKMHPTQQILEMPEFHEKSLLLKELVLQNRDLREEMSAFSQRRIALKEENDEIRGQMRKTRS
jgi:chromosome segregation ATPase